MREMTLTVPDSFEGAQAQDLLKTLGFSRRAVIKLKQSGGLARNGAPLRAVDIIHAGERLTVRLSEEEPSELPQPNPELHVPIVYQDEDVVVFNKPPYMPVHPSIRHYSDTLANLFAALFPGLPFRPINRLDRNTSGLCVCAKNRFAACSLSESLEKVYFAVTDGTPPGDTIAQPIGREDGSIIKRCVMPGGSPAVTHFSAVGGNGRSAAGDSRNRAHSPDTGTHGVPWLFAVRRRALRRRLLRDPAAGAPLRRGDIHPAGEP